MIPPQVRRPLWRKGLRATVSDAYEGGGYRGVTSPDAASPDTPSPVALVAGAMADLHEALRTDKARGVFCRGGPWDARLRELAEGESSLPGMVTFVFITCFSSVILFY